MSFVVKYLTKRKKEDDYLNKVVFSDESILHLSGKVNRHYLLTFSMDQSPS